MLNTDKELKLYYSIGEVADMFGVNPSLLRFWEKEFPQISPKTAGRGIRQYRKEDVETIGLIYHLVKEKGMTLPGARQRLKDNKEATVRNYEIVNKSFWLLNANWMDGSRITLIDNECVDQCYSSTRLTCLIFCIFFRLLQMVFTSSTSCTHN